MANFIWIAVAAAVVLALVVVIKRKPPSGGSGIGRKPGGQPPRHY